MSHKGMALVSSVMQYRILSYGSTRSYRLKEAIGFLSEEAAELAFGDVGIRELGTEEAALIEVDAVKVVEAAHTDACSKASLIATDCTYTANAHSRFVTC